MCTPSLSKLLIVTDVLNLNSMIILQKLSQASDNILIITLTMHRLHKFLSINPLICIVSYQINLYLNKNLKIKEKAKKKKIGHLLS